MYGSITLNIPEEINDLNIPGLPENYGLHQNYPNPFNPDSEFSFKLKNDSMCELTIYNARGKKVKHLYAGDALADQIYSFIWDGKNEKFESVASGLYFYELKVNGKIQAVKKCILMK